VTKPFTDLPVKTSLGPDDLIAIVDNDDGLSKSVKGSLVGASSAESNLFLDFVANESFLLDDTNSSGTGAVAPVEGGHAEADEGYGILELDTGAGIGLARIEHGTAGVPFHAFRGSLSMVAEFRVKFPATPADITFSCGFDNAGTPASAKVLYAEGVGTWAFLIESTVGGNTDSEATAIAAVAGWHTLRIEWDAGVEARFYVDDVLVSTLTGVSGDAVPAGADDMTLYIEADTAGATAGAVYADWLRLRQARA